ncbi:MAG: FecR domain-containing protein [Bacteroidota bacterium]
MQENYLAKWLNNELSEEELAEFKKSDEYASYARILKASDTLRAPNFDSEKAYATLRQRRDISGTKVVQLHPFRSFLKVAAVIALLLTASYFFLNTLDEEVTTQFAENKEVVLPDESEILLNADSHITYSEKNWEKDRYVTLEGEAFFKVAKGKRFTVATKDGTVTVLGTQFNVENRKDFFEVSCYEGLVSVLFKGAETKLPAGNSFLVINGKIRSNKVAENTIPSWVRDESSFKSIPLGYVLDEFERQHNITVRTQNIDLNQLYTGTFSNTNTDLALQSISVPSQIKYKLEGNKVLFYAENAP